MVMAKLAQIAKPLLSSGGMPVLTEYDFSQ